MINAVTNTLPGAHLRKHQVHVLVHLHTARASEYVGKESR